MNCFPKFSECCARTANVWRDRGDRHCVFRVSIFIIIKLETLNDLCETKNFSVRLVSRGCYSDLHTIYIFLILILNQMITTRVPFYTADAKLSGQCSDHNSPRTSRSERNENRVRPML
eukprot:sb/3476419/